MISESEAVELARKEFTKTGRKLEGYSTRVEIDSTARNKWIVWFVMKGDYVPAGGKHFVTVEKSGGKATFMPGE